MNDAANSVNSASGQSEDADQKQFDKLFTELLTESTASDDPKLVDAMNWFKQASMCCRVAIEKKEKMQLDEVSYGFDSQ